MAYFANSTEGANFHEQCLRCKYGDRFCPIAYVQSEYNYEAVDNKVATSILNELVSNNGTCRMFYEFQHDFEVCPKCGTEWTADCEQFGCWVCGEVKKSIKNSEK